MQPISEDAWPIGRPFVVAVGDVEDPQGKGGFKDRITGMYVNNATAAVTVVRDAETGDPIQGLSLPIAGVFLTDSKGVYWAEIPAAAEITEGQKVHVCLVLTTGGKANPFWFRFFGQLP